MRTRLLNITWSNLRFNVWRYFVTMVTNLPSCFSIQFLEQMLKFLENFTLLKYVKSWRSYGFLITKELIFGFQILDLKDHFSASLSCSLSELQNDTWMTKIWRMIEKYNQFRKLLNRIKIRTIEANLFSAAIRSCFFFQNPHFTDTFATVYNWWQVRPNFHVVRPRKWIILSLERLGGHFGPLSFF